MDEEDDIDYDYEDDYEDDFDADETFAPTPSAGNLENCLCGFSAAECAKREC